MNAQELLQIINNICFQEFADINIMLAGKIKKELSKRIGDFEIVSETYYKGREEVEIKTPHFIYKGKGEYQSIVIYCKEHNIYLNERRLYIPRFRNGACTDYQGSTFWEVKPKGKSFVDVEELDVVV
jgi:hypothetical protein